MHLISSQTLDNEGQENLKSCRQKLTGKIDQAHHKLSWISLLARAKNSTSVQFSRAGGNLETEANINLENGGQQKLRNGGPEYAYVKNAR